MFAWSASAAQRSNHAGSGDAAPPAAPSARGSHPAPAQQAAACPPRAAAGRAPGNRARASARVHQRNAPRRPAQCPSCGPRRRNPPAGRGRGHLQRMPARQRPLGRSPTCVRDAPAPALYTACPALAHPGSHGGGVARVLVRTGLPAVKELEELVHTLPRLLHAHVHPVSPGPDVFALCLLSKPTV